MNCSLRLIVQTLVFSPSYLHRQMSPPETLVVKGGTTWTRNGRKFRPKAATSTHTLSGSFTYRKYATRDKRLYFPSERRRAEDFFALKNLTASAGFEPANLGTTLPIDHRSHFNLYHIQGPITYKNIPDGNSPSCRFHKNKIKSEMGRIYNLGTTKRQQQRTM